ncbi:hypothetical protein M758_8G053400 [Ceratodon purpureus]|nr:hypothetical protein M758_8G053400 [Ceratodon purpureus]KAG0607766.1 hypothetical protein M758_8G053400 [Ceratodon purpureus]KAG0607767.1 hypothetical protein M758_8G053400 [Ceratodon purpureus]KAG0607768.1 hypothetical protein M758_8G053400 [Ceratodon purpureus]
MSSPASDQHGLSSTSMEQEVLKILKENNAQLRDRIRRLEEEAEQRRMFMIEENRKLEAQVVELQQQLAVLYRELDQVLRLRDSLLFEAEVAQQLREEDEEEPINEIDMEMALLQLQEVEADENRRMRLATGH